jgi:hypothetical protein
MQKLLCDIYPNEIGMMKTLKASPVPYGSLLFVKTILPIAGGHFVTS